MNGWQGCQSDDQCAEGLSCYNEHEKTDEKTEQVSGCSMNKFWIFGYCYTKDKSYQPPDIPHLLEAPANDDFVLTNVVDAPEECAVYAADMDKVVDVPFRGSSGTCVCNLRTYWEYNVAVCLPIFPLYTFNTDVGVKNELFHRVTYIYVIDASMSTRTFMAAADCGDGNSDRGVKSVIDCEILAIQSANEAANAGGNVDLVGLISFNNTVKVLQPLIEPWARVSPDRRDPAVIDQLRTVTPKEATNYQAGVEEACKMAREPANDNDLTVVIFVSDGAPNLGTSTKDTIMNNCGKAVFKVSWLRLQIPFVNVLCFLYI
jgi:hypothetical protein